MSKVKNYLLTIGLLLSLGSTSGIAAYSGGCCYPVEDCGPAWSSCPTNYGYATPCWGDNVCCDNPCDCSSNYDCGRVSLTVFGGVVPTRYTVQSHNHVFERNPSYHNEPFSSRLPNFYNQYDTPWTVGAEVGYFFCKRTEVFFDFDYTTASTKDHQYTGLYGRIDEHYSRYRAYGYYLGARYYFPTCFSCITPFFGGKVGLLHRNSATAYSEVEISNGLDVEWDNVKFKKGDVVSGGLQLGFNWDFFSCLAVVVKAELLVSGDWETGFLETRSPGPYVCLGKTGPVGMVPVTIGLRYTY